MRAQSLRAVIPSPCPDIRFVNLSDSCPWRLVRLSRLGDFLYLLKIKAAFPPWPLSVSWTEPVIWPLLHWDEREKWYIRRPGRRTGSCRNWHSTNQKRRKWLLRGNRVPIKLVLSFRLYPWHHLYSCVFRTWMSNCLAQMRISFLTLLESSIVPQIFLFWYLQHTFNCLKILNWQGQQFKNTRNLLSYSFIKITSSLLAQKPLLNSQSHFEIFCSLYLELLKTFWPDYM